VLDRIIMIIQITEWAEEDYMPG